MGCGMISFGETMLTGELIVFGTSMQVGKSGVGGLGDGVETY